MVDLAKIRKKAKKKEERNAGEAGGAADAPAASSSPAVSSGSQRAVEAAAAPQSVAAAPDSAVPAVPQVTSDKLDRFKAQAGQRREVREERVVEETHDQLELLTFALAGEQYAVDIERIVEIVTPRSVTRIPNADPSVVGIISLRGTIVTLVDVRRRLRHRAGPETPDTRIVVIDFRNETVGFVVDRVQRVVKLARSAVEPHPVVHTTELEESIRGVFRTGGALTILLDLDKLLDHSHGTDL
jgi:purine-binding chemotaxis protein CheW